MPATRSGYGAGAALCLLTVLIWGAQFPIGKSALAVMDGVHATVIRYVIATVLMIALLALTEGRDAFRYYGRFGRVATAGALGFTLSGLLIFIGLELTRPEIAAIIVALQPAMTALGTWAIYGRRPKRFTLACMALAFVGVVMVVTKGSLDFAAGGRELAGDALVLAGGVMWVSYTILSERIGGWSAVRYTTLALLPGTAGILVIALVANLAGWIRPPTAAQAWSVAPQLAYLGTMGLVVSMVAWTAGIARIGAVNAMLFASLVPVVAFAIRALQGVRFSPIEIAGAVLVVGALVASNLYARRLARVG
jgi:drug/metabolite transporter (DMT)-like permease